MNYYIGLCRLGAWLDSLPASYDLVPLLPICLIVVSPRYIDQFFLFFYFFLYHMFIVSTVQEMTCIFNDMAKTKPIIKITINKRNNRNHFPQRDQ